MGTRITVDTVQLKVLSPSKSVVMEAIYTPFICSDILSQNVYSVASQYEHLQNLTLADSSRDGNKRTDILVGVDYYYSCVGSEIKRGSGNQPLAISSTFSWILCGCNETQRNVHNNLNSTHALRLSWISTSAICLIAAGVDLLTHWWKLQGDNILWSNA